jgi:hypothetical protein
VKVCAAEKCAVTDENGHYKIDGVSLPTDLSLKVGQALVGSVKVESDKFDITPKVLIGENNDTTAAALGAMLHQIGEKKGADLIDLSNVKSLKMNAPSLVDEIKKNPINAKVEVVGNKTSKQAEINATVIDEYKQNNPGMVTNILTYRGETTNSKALVFKFNTKENEITYRIPGEEGSMTIDNLYNNFVYKDMDDNLYFFSGNIGVGAFDDMLAVGIQAYQDNSEVNLSNKALNLALVNSSTDNLTMCVIPDVRPDQTFVAYCSDGWKGQFHWSMKDNIMSFSGTDNSHTGRFYFRPAYDGRISLVGNIDGWAAFGSEAKPITAAELNGAKFTYFASDEEGYCYGDVEVKGSKLTHADKYCSEGGAESGTATLTLNPVIHYGNNTYELNGFVKVVEDNDPDETSYAMIDPSNGYFILLSNEGDIVVGSNKPVK